MPFPYADSERRQMRPALVLSHAVGPAGELYWFLMITSARNSAWPGDVDVGSGHADFGLPVPCYVRTAKVAALSTREVDRRLGQLPTALLAKVQEQVGEHLGFRA